MPHITVEYSSNLLERPYPQSFLRRLNDTLVSLGAYNMVDIKSRLVMHDDFVVSDGEKGQGFVHLHLAIMPRDKDVMKKTSTALMDVLKETFAASSKDKNCAMSVEIRLLEKDLYVKTAGGTL